MRRDLVATWWTAGIPIAQGSIKGVPCGGSFPAARASSLKGLFLLGTDRRGRPRMWRAEPGWANKDTLKPWRDALCLTARQRWGDRDPLPSAIVEMVFVFKRPKSHRRADGSLRDGFTELHLVKPDADKLARAALDSLTDAAVIVDDRRVVRLSAEKKYGRDPGVQIAVYRLITEGLFDASPHP